MSIALANSPLPSARNSILPPAPVDLLPRLHDEHVVDAGHRDGVDALGLDGVGVVEEARHVQVVAGRREGAGHGEQRDLLALEDFVGGLRLGASAVMTRNLALGNLSPTLMGMACSLVLFGEFSGSAEITRLRGGLVETGLDLVGALAVDHGEGQLDRAFWSSTPGGKPSSSKREMLAARRARPASGLGMGSAHSGVGPSANTWTGLPLGDLRSTATSGLAASLTRCDRAAPAQRRTTGCGTRASAAASAASSRAVAARERQLAGGLPPARTASRTPRIRS